MRPVMKINRSILLGLLLAITLPVQAEVYKWVDSEGKTHFTDAKPADAAAAQKIDLVEESLPPPHQAQASTQPQKTVVAPQVDLYVTSWCPYCKKAIAFLQSNDIAFNVYDIEQDPAAAERKRALDPDYAGIPLAVINGVQIQGFDVEEYSQALAIQAH